MQEHRPVCVERIAVKPDRISLRVRCASSARFVTREVAKQVGEHFPNIVHHACLNDFGPTFGDALENTSVPHLMEHLIIELQAADRFSGQPLMGTTEWVNKREGLARVEVSYKDDIVALRAVSEAQAFLNEIL